MGWQNCRTDCRNTNGIEFSRFTCPTINKQPLQLQRTYMRMYNALILVVFLGLSTQVFAQSMENYMDRKKSLRKEPNQFLSGESMDKTSQLGKFYRDSFRKNQQQKGSQYLRNEGLGSSSSGTNQIFSVPLEGPIDPDTYIVGPGDVFAVSIWGALSISVETVINPEGGVLIPNIGVAMLGNATLTEAKAIVEKTVRKKYDKTEVSFSLLAPRLFAVHVSGIVSNPGRIEVYSVDRADKAIYMATLSSGLPSGAESDLTSPSESSGFVSVTESIPVEEPPISMRNILVLRGKDTLYVDLLGYYATGNLEYNPRLLDGDIIVVPVEQLEENSISVSGGVRLPGTFEYHPNDNLAIALQVSQGFKKNAISDSIVVSRVAVNGNGILRFVVNGNKVLNGELDFVLQPGDKIFVHERSRSRRNPTVSVKGEVNINGEFPIIDGQTTLRSIIENAGGFTANAALAEAIVLRKDPGLELDPVKKNPDYRRLSEMRLSDLLKEERDYFTYEAAIRRNQVSVDFKDLFLGGNLEQDVALYDGDEIIVPSATATVYVFGQIARPGHVAWFDDMDIDFYIERAGDVSDAADESSAKVIKAGSKNWVDAGDTTIEPGDAIYIPRELDRDFVFYFTAIRDFLQVTISAVTIYLLIQQISNK
jgi:polysaccharide biosynthesis/export protein